MGIAFEPTLAATAAGSDLLLVRLRVDPRHIEDVLYALSQTEFPINPELRHLGAQGTDIEFPAFREQIRQAQQTLTAYGFAHLPLDTQPLWPQR